MKQYVWKVVRTVIERQRLQQRNINFHHFNRKSSAQLELVKKMTEVVAPPTASYPATSAPHHHGIKDSKILIHTGNLANWTNVKSRKSNDMPANELYQGLYRTITKYEQQQTQQWNDEETLINCTNIEKLNDTERGLLKVTAKIFLQKFEPKSMTDAVSATLKQLGLRSIDNIFLALPPMQENQAFAETVLPLWEEMERFRDAGIALQISSCDLDCDKLKALVNMVKIRPEVNQVNLTSCCHMPEDLVRYAKEIGVLLHTHGDQPVMLPEENLESLINKLRPNELRMFSADWIVRYAVVIKCRGVIKNKGYIVAIDAVNNKL